MHLIVMMQPRGIVAVSLVNGITETVPFYVCRLYVTVTTFTH